ncbi:MAG: twin-arginine translocase TatA/TatE family subunit [Ignavibacteriae bacterium]|nr:twin-arginine translocase TatA/TatE family subunit [Ignavibacteriota bacterium]
MFDVGGGELLLIFVAVLLLFGPKKIPEVMRSVGKGLRQFRDAQEGLKQQMRDLSADVEKLTNIEEEQIRVTPKKVEEIPQAISPNQVSMEIDGQVSMEIENQFPEPEESQFPDPEENKLTETSHIIVPKPAESSVARNQPTAKKVFDDTIYDNGAT